MLYYDRTDISEGTDFNKTSTSEQYDICHYWYLLNKGFKFQSYVCNRCDDLVMMSMKLTIISILNTKGSDNRCNISGFIKSEAINLMQNIDLIKKAEYYKT